jgi:ribosomal protein S18 acetylase RimI-like enzyme
MSLVFRLATPADYNRLEELVIASFEPITWFRRADERFGPMNGLDWRARWRLRFTKVFHSQIVLVGEEAGEIAAIATGTIEPETRLGYIDLLAVDQRRQGRGYGRAMLHGMLRHMREQGAEHVHLECLTTNQAGNALYQSEGFQEVARSIRWLIKIS